MRRLSWIALDWDKTHICAFAIGDSGDAVESAIWDGPKVAIIGDREITRLYQIALNSRGCSPTVFDATKALIAGLRPLVDLPTESSVAA